MKRIVLLDRWGFWWFAAWTAVAFWTQAAAESCRTAGDACAGFDQTAYDNSDVLFIAAIVVAIAGGIALGKMQDRANSRPCPRCGDRVFVGVTECSACGFDFDQRTAPR